MEQMYNSETKRDFNSRKHKKIAFCDTRSIGWVGAVWAKIERPHWQITSGQINPHPFNNAGIHNI